MPWKCRSNFLVDSGRGFCVIAATTALGDLSGLLCEAGVLVVVVVVVVKELGQTSSHLDRFIKASVS